MAKFAAATMTLAELFSSPLQVLSQRVSLPTVWMSRNSDSASSASTSGSLQNTSVVTPAVAAGGAVATSDMKLLRLEVAEA